MAAVLRAAAAAALFVAALAAGPEQIHISYTGKLGELSVDFVCAAGGAGSVGFTADGKAWAQANATFFTYASIGDMQQALIAPASTPAPGAALSYYCACADGSRSAVFDVTPVPARYPSEVHVVFGDFGLLNDVSMAPLIADSSSGVFDSVLHVGDWAYNFEDSQSAVGSQFMNAIQGYAALRPVMPVAGNRESAPRRAECAAARARRPWRGRRGGRRGATSGARPNAHSHRPPSTQTSRATPAPPPTRCRSPRATSPSTARASTP